MTWFGGIVLGLGLVLVVALGGRKVLQVVRLRRDRSAQKASYAARLDLDAENGLQDEVHQMALALIREHGAGAVIKAARRALSTLDEGDAKSEAVWQRVLESAEACQQKEARENEFAD